MLFNISSRPQDGTIAFWSGNMELKRSKAVMVRDQEDITRLSVKRTLYSEKNMNSLNVEYFLAMNIQNLDKNG